MGLHHCPNREQNCNQYLIGAPTRKWYTCIVCVGNLCPIGALTRILFWATCEFPAGNDYYTCVNVDSRIGAPIQFHMVSMWVCVDIKVILGHRFSSMATIFAPMTCFVTGTISEDQTDSESAIESCVYITSQLVLISPCLHRLKTTSTIALWRQWDCAKALSWVGTVQDKSRAAEAANAEMVAKLLTAEASLSEAREEILVL